MHNPFKSAGRLNLFRFTAIIVFLLEIEELPYDFIIHDILADCLAEYVVYFRIGERAEFFFHEVLEAGLVQVNL